RRVPEHVASREQARRRVAWTFDDRQRRYDEAVAVLRRPGEIPLGVNGAGEVVVQVAALRHLVEKGAEADRVAAQRGEAARRCRLRRGRRLCRLTAGGDADDRDG